MVRKKVDKLARVSTGKPKVYKGKRPATPQVWDASPELTAVEVKLGPRLARFLPLAIQYDAATAARRMNPELSPRTARVRGHRMLEQCRDRLNSQDWDALYGCYRSRIMETISEGLGATTKKSFILPRTGEIRETDPEPDWATRLQAAALLSKIHKLQDPDHTQPFTVNVINYSKPGDPKWPGYEGEVVDSESIPCEGGKED